MKSFPLSAMGCRYLPEQTSVAENTADRQTMPIEETTPLLASSPSLQRSQTTGSSTTAAEDDPESAVVRYVILDFKHVPGVDATVRVKNVAPAHPYDPCPYPYPLRRVR
jgi:hypothetical protein